MISLFIADVLYAAIKYTVAQHRRERVSDPCPNPRCGHASDGYCRMAMWDLLDGLAWAYNARMATMREV